jgi:hypothetical protein
LSPRARTIFTPLEKRVTIDESVDSYSNSIEDAPDMSRPGSTCATVCAPHMATSVAKS